MQQARRRTADGLLRRRLDRQQPGRLEQSPQPDPGGTARQPGSPRSPRQQRELRVRKHLLGTVTTQARRASGARRIRRPRRLHRDQTPADQRRPSQETREGEHRPCRRRGRHPTTVAQRPGEPGANSSRLHPVDLYDNSGTTYRQIAVLKRLAIEQVSLEPPEWVRSLLERIGNMPGPGLSVRTGDDPT